MSTGTDQLRKSLLWRLFLTFSGCVMFVWLLVVAWLVASALLEGRRVMERELGVFSQQLLPLVESLRDRPEAIHRVLSNFSILEATLDDSEIEDILIDVTVDGDRVYAGAEVFPASKRFASPTLIDGFQEFSGAGVVWWSFASSNLTKDVSVRVAVESFTSAELSMPDQLATFFLPLFVSLPLLLIPAWFMARFALRPLGETAKLISDRVASGTLDEIPVTPYGELNSVVLALNRLLARLASQLQRERSLVAEVAHELKTPLAILQTNQGILKRSSNPDRRAAALQDLGAGVVRCNHLVQQLLGLARLERELDTSGIVRNIDLAEFVRLRLAHAEPLASTRSISLDLHAPDALPLALDVDAFAAALDNLLDNAIKYSPQGGNVRVELESVDGGVRLCVSDGGAGIAPADRDRAFRRFERLVSDQPVDTLAAAVPEGAGLGLTIVQRAVARLCGSLRLDYSCPTTNSGLTVEVFVPDESAKPG